MGMIMPLALITLLAYLLGSVNLSIILSKLLKKGDIREQGSKNAGATNTLRVLGKGPAVLVLLWDVLKGVLAVVIARAMANLATPADATQEFILGMHWYATLLAGLGAILGHNYPIYFGFKGGKGVATSLGVILTIEWQIGCACLVAGIVSIALFGFVSVGSITAAILYPILVVFMGGYFDTMSFNFASNPRLKAIYILFSLIIAASLIIRHKANIDRIKNGTESKLKFKKTAEEKIAEEKAKKEAKEIATDDKKEDKVAETKEVKDEAKKDVTEEVKKEENIVEVKEEVKEEVKTEAKDEKKADEVKAEASDEEIPDIKFEKKKNK